MTAGSGSYTVSWKPNLRFPGQYQDVDQYPFVQNHYREYLPRFGRYNRVDPIIFVLFNEYMNMKNVFIYNNINKGDYYSPIPISQYIYVKSNPLIYKDPTGEFTFIELLVGASIIIAGGVVVIILVGEHMSFKQCIQAEMPKCMGACLQMYGSDCKGYCDAKCDPLVRGRCSEMSAGIASNLGGEAYTSTIYTILLEKEQ